MSSHFKLDLRLMAAATAPMKMYKERYIAKQNMYLKLLNKSGTILSMGPVQFGIFASIWITRCYTP